MASHRLIENRIIDRLSVNKSNKSEEKPDTKFDDIMADFVGTWIFNSVLSGIESDNVMIIEKAGDKLYTFKNTLTLKIGTENIIGVESERYITEVSINNCGFNIAYNEFRDFFNPVPLVGVNESTIPYNGVRTTFTLTKDKKQFHSTTILQVDRIKVLEQLEKYAVLQALWKPEFIVGTSLFIPSANFIKQ